MLERPTPQGSDAVTTLRHFAIVTYAVPPERLAGLVHDRFEPDCVEPDGARMALLSVVPFEDQDFRAAAFPSPRMKCGQTNYLHSPQRPDPGTDGVPRKTSAQSPAAPLRHDLGQQRAMIRACIGQHAAPQHGACRAHEHVVDAHQRDVRGNRPPEPHPGVGIRVFQAR